VTLRQCVVTVTITAAFVASLVSLSAQGTEKFTEEQLAELVTRNAMVGVSKVPSPGAKA